MAPSPEDVAEYVTERAKANPRVRQIIEDVRVFEGLQEHAGWRRLLEVVSDAKDRSAIKLGRRLMHGAEIEQREIDYVRGRIDGALWILQHPEQVETNLELAARLAYAEAQSELISEDEIPYL